MAAIVEPVRLSPPSEVHGWKATSANALEVTPKTIFDYMNGAGELYLAYDFRRLLVWTYQRDGDTTIAVEAYDMGTAEDAFGILSHDLSGDKVNIGRQSAYTSGFLQFRQGRWYFRILAEMETPESRQAVLALGRALAAQAPDEGKEPEIVKRLPAKGLAVDSVHYFHTQICLNTLYFFAVQNLLQLSRQTDVVMGDYRVDAEPATLLIIQYPNAPDAAKARATFLKGYLPELPDSPDPVRLAQIENGEWVGLRLEGKYLALAFKSRSRDVCERLLGAVNLKQGGKRE